MTDTTVDFATAISVHEMGLRLLLSLVFGGIVGFEREARHEPAGLRTHMLVSLASCAFILIALEMIGDLSGKEPAAMRLDASRVVQAIVTGVGFLGAGAIIRARGVVRGINTGATIWLSGAIGIACGCGFYIIATMTSAGALIVLVLLGFAERRWHRSHGKPD